MSTRKLRHSWWVDFRFNGTRYRKRSPENSNLGAKAYELLLRQRLTRGEPIGDDTEQEQPVPSFKEFSEQWYKTYVLTNNKLSEQMCKRFTLSTHLIPFFGNQLIDRISTQMVEEYKSAKMRLGLKPKTINNHLTILGKCLHTAREWIDENLSCPKIRFLKVPPQPYDILSPHECQRLLEAIDNWKWHTMVLLAMQTGMRIGELLGLEWKDIDFATNYLTVRQTVVRGIVGTTKNNRVRWIPISRSMTDYLKGLGGTSGFVFGSDKPLSYRCAREALRSYCLKAGLRLIGWHTLRHSFASTLASQGVSIQSIQGLLGHSEIRMTMRYAHLAPSALREAIRVFEEPAPKNLGQQAVNATKGLTTPVIRKAAVVAAFSQ